METFADILIDKDANETIAEYVREKSCERVTDLGGRRY